MNSDKDEHFTAIADYLVSHGGLDLDEDHAINDDNDDAIGDDHAIGEDGNN